MQTVVIDNGSHRCRIGFSTDLRPRVDVPNCVARIRRSLHVLVGDETESGAVADTSALHYFRALDRGYLTDTTAETLVWERALRLPALRGGSGAASDARTLTSESALLLTHAPLTPPSILASTDELVFETLGWDRYARAPTVGLAGQSLRVRKGGGGQIKIETGLGMPTNGSGVIVDLGYSASLIAPVFNWNCLPTALRRVDVGGATLTAALRATLSLRQLNLMEDTHLVDQVKTKLCFVAHDYRAELGAAAGLSTTRQLAKAAAVARRRRGGGGGAKGDDGEASLFTQPPPDSPSTPPSSEKNPHSSARARPTRDGAGIGISRHFVLPDFKSIMKGYVKGGPEDPAGEAVTGALSSDPVEAKSIASSLAATLAVEKDEEGNGSTRAAVAVVVGGGAIKRPREEKKNEDEEMQVEVVVEERQKKPAAIVVNDDGGDGEDGDEDEDDDDDEEEEEEEEEEGSDDDDSGGDEYREKKGKKTTTTTTTATTTTTTLRRGTSRAASRGVSLLTAELRREGVLAEGEEDAEGGGARDTRIARTDGSRAFQVGAGAAVSSSTITSSSSMMSAAAVAAAAMAGAAAQSLFLNTERISIPELLFSPSDAGYAQLGLPAMIASAVNAAPAYTRPLLWSSIVLVGGGAHLPGLEVRLKRELRALAPAGMGVELWTPPEPELAVWRGAAARASETDFLQMCVTKQMWKEEGPVRCTARLNAMAENLGAGPMMIQEGPADKWMKE